MCWGICDGNSDILHYHSGWLIRYVPSDPFFSRASLLHMHIHGRSIDSG